MKKILLLTPSIKVGGSERVLLNLASLLLNKGYEVHCIFCVEDTVLMPIPKSLIIHKNFLPKIITSKFYKMLTVRNYIKKLNDKENFSIIISNFLTSSNWLPKYIENKTFYYLHSDYSSVLDIMLKTDPKNKKEKLKKKIFSYYNKRNIITVSQGSANSLISTFGVKPNKVELIYNFFSFETIRNQAKENIQNIPNEPYIIHVGRFDIEYKRQDLLFDALNKMNTDIKLVLLTENTKELNNLIIEKNVANRVIVAGYQSNPYAWMRNAQRLILCSDHEALPMVLVESLICGTPTISTNCKSGPNEILTGELSKWLVPCNNSDKLAQKIDESLNTNIDISENLISKFSENEALMKIEKLIIENI